MRGSRYDADAEREENGGRARQTSLGQEPTEKAAEELIETQK